MIMLWYKLKQHYSDIYLQYNFSIQLLKISDVPNIIPKHVYALLESELQMITQNNDALILANQQLTTQLNDNTKLLETKEQEVQQLRRELQACKGEEVHAERLL